MVTSELIKIGNRIFDLNSITHASLEQCSKPGIPFSWVECAVSFGNDDCLIFYGEEAEQVWKIVCYHTHLDATVEPGAREDAA